MKVLNNIITTNRQDKTNHLFLVFIIWSFILLCRPQDYIIFLEYLRPNLSLGLVTMLLYLLTANSLPKISANTQIKLYKYFFIIMIASVPFSYYRSASLMDLISYISIVMFVFLFYQLSDTIDKLLKILVLYCSGVGIYEVFILISGDLSGGRISVGRMFDPNDIAFYIISFLPFNLLFISNINRAFIRVISAINLIVGLVVILKTGSRGGLIALIAVCVYLLFKKTKTVKITFMKKAMFAIVAVALLQFVNMSTERYKTILDLKDDYNFTEETGRIGIWKTGITLMLSHPFTGVGINRFPEAIGLEREKIGLPPKWQTAHNSLVQIGTETGIFGLILFCFMSINVFRITGDILNKSQSEELLKVTEMLRVAFLGHLICAFFISQAYSVYWAFIIVLSAVLQNLFECNAKSCGLFFKTHT